MYARLHALYAGNPREGNLLFVMLVVHQTEAAFVLRHGQHSHCATRVQGSRV